MKYIDPDGNEILRYSDAYTMQDSRWGKDSVGNGSKPMSAIGCAVTLVAKALTRLLNPGDFTVSPKNINSNKGNFTGSNIDMSKAAGDYGVSYDYWTTKTDLKAKLNELKQSDQSYAVGAQVKYNADGDTHFVGVNDIATFDGKDYIEVSPTSGGDSSKPSRPRDSWMERDGKMYVELKDVVGIRQFSLED